MKILLIFANHEHIKVCICAQNYVILAWLQTTYIHRCFNPAIAAIQLNYLTWLEKLYVVIAVKYNVKGIVSDIYLQWIALDN